MPCVRHESQTLRTTPFTRITRIGHLIYSACPIHTGINAMQMKCEIAYYIKLDTSVRRPLPLRWLMLLLLSQCTTANSSLSLGFYLCRAYLNRAFRFWKKKKKMYLIVYNRDFTTFNSHRNEQRNDACSYTLRAVRALSNCTLHLISQPVLFEYSKRKLRRSNKSLKLIIFEKKKKEIRVETRNPNKTFSKPHN